ncbi:MAG: translation initiation factor IF-2 [Selenomonadaceae bacterium]|nr:translation initiation factor IF-2 [Selenomonadaceae bacterium]
MSRVYELAKKFNIDSKKALDILKKRGFKVSNNFSSVGDAEYEALKEALRKAKAKPEANNEAVKSDKSKETPKQETQKKTAEEFVKAEKKNSQEKSAKTDSVEKVEKSDKTDKSEKGERREKHDRNDKSDRGDRSDRNNRRDKEDRGDRGDRGNRGDKSDRNDRSEKGDKSDRNNAFASKSKDNFASGKRDKFSDRADRNDRGDRSDRGDRVSKSDGGDRDGRKKDSGREARDNSSRNNNRPERNKNNRDKRRGDDRMNERGEERQRFGGRKDKRNKKNAQQPQKVEIARPKHIKISDPIVVKDLASKMSCTATEVVKKLLLMGVMANINQNIDFTTAALVADSFGVTAEELPPEVDPTEIPEIEDDPKTLKLRPPVVTVMGHVDHGKTSLLDVIRKTSVSAHEAGGITQHIGAYQVMSKDKKIVFLDTPGHEAFTAMRARGAQVTDIAILVVAADDGVMPQTIEAIHHAKSANVPIIVAINKIDKPGANPDRVKQELMEKGLVPEEYGGDTIMVPVSAKQKIGISELLEMVLLVAEVQELKANPNREARGVIIEAELDKGKGPVATVLVQNGTLRIGDSIIAGTVYGKVRAMVNDRGDNVRKAGPSVPVEVLGFNDVPAAGDLLAVLDEKQARSIAEARQERQRTKLMKSKKVSLDNLFQQIQEGSIKDLNIVIKADVQGSVEALTGSLLSLNKNDEVRVSIVHSGVGAVSESDVMLASASNALIIAFNVRPDANARRKADTENIDIRTYQVIYDALNDVKDAMSGMLAPKYKEVVQGHVEIRQVMKFSKALVAGSYVLDGKIYNDSKIRILRDNIVIFDGEIDSLRRFKDEVKEVAAGYECGISIIDFRDFKEGDIIEPYKMEEVEVSIQDANREATKRREEAAADNDTAAKGEGE